MAIAYPSEQWDDDNGETKIGLYKTTYDSALVGMYECAQAILEFHDKGEYDLAEMAHADLLLYFIMIEEFEAGT